MQDYIQNSWVGCISDWTRRDFQLFFFRNIGFWIWNLSLHKQLNGAGYNDCVLSRISSSKMKEIPVINKFQFNSIVSSETNAKTLGKYYYAIKYQKFLGTKLHNLWTKITSFLKFQMILRRNAVLAEVNNWHPTIIS